MAPIKFEDKLKEKLENRSLQPSSGAWNTLSDRLDAEDKKNSNARFWWLGIAASILGVILVTTQFYKNTETKKNLPTVVETIKSTQSDSELITEPLNSDKLVTNSEEKKENNEMTNTTEMTSVPENKFASAQNGMVKEKTKLQLEEPKALVASQETSKSDINDNSPVKAISQEDLKIIEVVNVIKQLQASETSVTDAEIDSLLKQAQRDIIKQRIFNENNRTVNADALLQDVEVELEQSFRAKVFEALKSSYNSVITAVVERRN
jgi:hypothetical protein